jgi:hypothetical protein
MASFTPINRGSVDISAVNHGPRDRPHGLDSDNLYDIPDEPLQAGFPAPKKRKTSRVTKGRRKSASSSSLKHPWHKGTEKESSQLSTPPNSKKRTSIRSSTQKELFSDAAIGKPIGVLMELTTTQNALKAQKVCVGQTTMDKLASFRYQLPPQLNSVAGYPEKIGHIGAVADEPFLINLSNSHPGSQYMNEPNQDCYNASAADHDDILSTGDEAEQRTSQEGHSLFTELVSGDGFPMDNELAAEMAQTDSEDDFPVDDDFEAEMARLSMPNRLSGENLSQYLKLQSLNDKDLQSGNTGRGHLLRSSLSSHTHVGENNTATNFQSDRQSSPCSVLHLETVPKLVDQPIDRPALLLERHKRSKTGAANLSRANNPPENPAQKFAVADNIGYLPLQQFARPEFPSRVRDRSLINGVSSNIILRTCFRIGEALREGKRCEKNGQDAVIELFARVASSSKDASKPKLLFHFADMFSNPVRLLPAELENCKISYLQETESKMLLNVDGSPPMVRCLGRLKKTIAGRPGWMFHILNIRATDWEEVRWTKGIAGAGMMK